jgi:hypothetical protein
VKNMDFIKRLFITSVGYYRKMAKKLMRVRVKLVRQLGERT